MPSEIRRASSFTSFTVDGTHLTALLIPTGDLFLLHFGAANSKNRTGFLEVIAMKKSPRGRLMFLVIFAALMGTWGCGGSTNRGQQTSTVQAHALPVFGVAFSPDGKRLATASGDRSVKVWDLEKGEEVFILNQHKGAVWAVAFSPDGKRLASA